MKYFFLILTLVIPSIVVAQSANFQDDFTDQDISNWTGDNVDFTFVSELGNILLQQNAATAGSSQLSIPSTNAIGFWEFFVRLDFSPSNGNKAEFYLMSDSADFSQALDGYMLQAGEGGSNDVFRLFKITAGVKDGEVLTGTTSIASGGDFRVKVIRDAAGNWTLEVANSYSAPTVQETSGTDNTYTSTSFFGFKTTYTLSRIDLFFFDFKIEVPPIQVISASIQDATTINIAFSKDYDPATLQNSDFTINPGSINPTTINQPSSSSVELVFASDLPSGSLNFGITAIDDADNQTTLADTTITLFRFDAYQAGDVVINEFLKDPPGTLEEYVELKNTSSLLLNLKDWQLGDNGSLSTITDQDFALLPDSFVVITSDTAALKSVFGDVYAIEVSLPAFNNTTDQVRLYDENGATIDSLQYTPEWGGVDVALERRSATAPSIFIENWGDSPNPLAGTAGNENEIAQDNTPPDLESLSIINDSTMILVFTERINPDSAENPDNYDISLQVKALPKENEFYRVTYLEPDSVELVVKGGIPNTPFGGSLSISNQVDIFGNINPMIYREFQNIQTETAQPGDVFINEFVYDPPSGLTEFVEIYNPTNKVFNLKGWTLSDNTGNTSILTNEDFYLRKTEPTSGMPDNPYTILTLDSSISVLNQNRRIVMGSRFPTLNNTTDAIVLKNEQGVTIDSLTYTQDWGGEEVSLERRTVDVSGEFQENWGDSPSSEFATPTEPNQVEQDNAPPALESLSIINDSTFILTFTERLLKDSVENADNFDIQILVKALPNENEILKVSFIPQNTIRLDLKFKLSTREARGFVEIFNQSDIFGNINPRIDREYEYIQTETAQPGDVFINEFVYDPPSSLSEFVEIYNPTNKVFNLKGWTLSDNTGNTAILTNEDFYLRKTEPTSGMPDNPYTILTPDSSISVLNQNRRIVMGSRFPTLNNTTDAIVLKNAQGVTIDSLTYTQDWGGEEVSLERRTVDVTAEFQENWGNSPSPEFATPTEPNQVEDDNEAPFLQNTFATNNTSITLIYNERVDLNSAQNISNYSTSPSLSISSISLNRNQVNLNFGTVLQNETTYSITVNNQQDIFGNSSPTINTEVRYLVFSTSQPSDVVINEILYQKIDENSPEFVELYNRSNKNFDLSNWSISDAANNTATLSEGTSLEANGYLVLTDKQTFASSLPNGIFLSGFPSLNDNGDGIILKTSTETTIDSVFYDERFGGDKDGISAERKDPNAATNDLNNWNSNSSTNGNSAGVQNSIFQLDVIAPNLIFANLQNDGNVFVAFSEFIDPTGVTITIDDQTRNILAFNENAANKITVDGIGLEASSSLKLTATNLNDVVGNTLNSGSIPVSQQITKGAVIINEILYDPLSDDEDNLPDQTEYIELYNTQDYAISLEEIFLNDAPNEDNEVNRLDPISTSFKWIQPKGYFLIYSEDLTFSFPDSRLAEYFGIESQTDQFTMQIDRSSLSLSASGDAVFITDSSGTTIDSVYYDESWQNPNRVSVNGVALEKINPTGPSNDESNWSSSTEVTGGTPNQQNSIFQEQGISPDNTGISFTPNPFSPDDDGFEDFLSINYTLDEADYLLRVRVFDRYGREVRELVDGKPAGFSGNLIWDGLTADGNKNRVGIYIVLFKAYNSANGKDRTFKETVVIARKF